MILVDRHTRAGQGPFHATLRIMPASRIELINVRGKLLEEFGDDFTRYTRSFYISNHTTAGYLDQRLAELLEHDGRGIKGYLQLFQELFPAGADYTHDAMHLRSELSEEQRGKEPLNADSHLTFIGAGLHNSASYELGGSEPVWLVELDGVHVGGTRHRRTTVLDRIGLRDSLVERVVNKAVALPVSHFLRMKRGFSLPVLDRRGDGTGEIGWGTYQSPILVQWKGARQRTRALDARLVRFV